MQKRQDCASWQTGLILDDKIYKISDYNLLELNKPEINRPEGIRLADLI